MNVLMRLLLTSVFCVALTGATHADSLSNVAINGQVLSVGQLAQLENQIGTRVEPGNYLVNGLNGCWVNLTDGSSGCLGGGASAGNGGSSPNAGSDWYYNGGHSGLPVGGTADGCIYAGDWSNC